MHSVQYVGSRRTYRGYAAFECSTRVHGARSTRVTTRKGCGGGNDHGDDLSVFGKQTHQTRKTKEKIRFFSYLLFFYITQGCIACCRSRIHCELKENKEDQKQATSVAAVTKHTSFVLLCVTSRRYDWCAGCRRLVALRGSC